MQGDGPPPAAQAHSAASGADPTHTSTNAAGSGGALSCTPEQLYLHVVGRWPGPELGYPADHSDAHGQHGSSGGPTGSPDGSGEQLAASEHADDGRGDAAGASARAKKRRKIQRRAKVSEIWFPRAEMAFCTCVACIPPNGRTKIKFFGRPLGRNELIAAICTLATRRPYNRKQISSHSQVLKDKVPPPYKEIFTFEDKSRAGDEPNESSTANVIENYAFPDAIYNIIGYRVGSDLANAPKPAWLIDLEAGVSDQHHPGSAPIDPTTPRAYSFWANNSPSDYPSYYDRGGAAAYGKGGDRDSRAGQPGGVSGHPPPTSLDASSYGYPYAYRQQQPQSLPPFQSHLSPHSLPPLPLQRDMDPQSPVNSSGSAASSAVPGRYPYPVGTTQGGVSRGSWDEHARPGASPSYDTSQSQASAVSPRQPVSASWGTDTKPSLTGDHITLPPLQEVPSPSGNQYGDWKDRPVYQDMKWGAQPTMQPRNGRPAISTLPSFGSVASQSNNYSLLPSGGWSNAASGSTGGTLDSPASWNGVGSRASDRHSELPRLSSFVPAAFEATAQTPEGTLALSSNEPLISSAAPMPWTSIYMWKARYPFLESVAASPNVPVFHVDMPLMFPSNNMARGALLERILEFGLAVSLRPLGEASGWSLTTDSGFVNPRGTVRYARDVSPLRSRTNGDVTAWTRLADLPRLYEHLVRVGVPDERAGIGDALSGIAVPMSVVVQRIVRDTQTPDRSQPSPTSALGTDWASAAAVVIYTFWTADEGRPRPAICSQVDFDSAAAVPGQGPEDVAAEQLVAELLAGEEQQPSKFNWL